MRRRRSRRMTCGRKGADRPTQRPTKRQIDRSSLQSSRTNYSPLLAEAGAGSLITLLFTDVAFATVSEDSSAFRNSTEVLPSRRVHYYRSGRHTAPDTSYHSSSTLESSGRVDTQELETDSREFRLFKIHGKVSNKRLLSWSKPV